MTLYPQHRIRASVEEIERRDRFIQLFRQCPIPANEILSNLGLFLNGPALARILFMVELYQMIIPVQGSIVEFGTRWGQNLCIWTELRGFYEPYNIYRRIVGFDTFAGFPGVSTQDGAQACVGEYNTSPDYEVYLQDILAFHEAENPVPHIEKSELIRGDATKTWAAYLQKHQELIVALAYFDFDIYEPTKECLCALLPRLTKGSVIAFDQLNRPDFPGETLAVREILGLHNVALHRTKHSRANCYMVIK